MTNDIEPEFLEYIDTSDIKSYKTTPLVTVKLDDVEMNDYLVIYQCKCGNDIFSVSEIYSSKFPLCKELILSINEYIKNKLNTESFIILNIINLSNGNDDIVSKLLKNAEDVLMYYSKFPGSTGDEARKYFKYKLQNIK